MARADVVELAERAGRDELTEAELVALLGRLADEIEAAKLRSEALWRARTGVYHAARRVDPAPTLATIAEAARVSEVSVITALKKPDPFAS